MKESKIKNVDTTSILKRLINYWKPYKALAFFIILCLSLQELFDAYYAIGIKTIIDMLSSGESANFLWVIAALVVGLLVSTAAGMMSELLIAKSSSQIINDIRAQIFDHLQALSMDFFARSKAGDISTRFLSDLDPVAKLVTDQLMNALVAVLSLIINIPILVWFNWKLTLILFALLPTVVIIQRMFSARAASAAYELKKAEGAFISEIQETVRIQPAIKLFGLQTFLKKRFQAQIDHVGHISTRSEFLSGMLGDTSTAALRVIRLAIIGVGGILVLRHDMTPGSLVGFVSLLASINGSVSDLTRRFIPGLIKGSASFRRIDDILKVVPTVLDHPGIVTSPRLSRRIRFEGVTFGYQKDQVNLKNVNLTIPVNHSVAIVGPSGSGKSTLLGLIPRFYDPQSGTVSIDDQPIGNFSQASLREQMGMVFQDTHLLNTSIRENIRLGNLKAPDDEIENAAKAAEIHQLIQSLPQGYDTMVGELGGRLSGGQRQRIAIARAILKDPPILLLDEASSALDPTTEHAINITLEALSKSRTVISVTHRLASAQNADIIFVMKDGVLVEQGKHKELLALQGVYADLWQKQHGFHIDSDNQKMSITPERLQAIPVFSEVSLDNLLQLAKVFTSKNYGENEIIFRQGEPGDQFYIVVRGKLEVVVAGNRRVGVLEDGDYFGEIALLTESPRTATVKAITQSALIALPRDQFTEFMKKEPAVRSVMESIMRQRRAAL